MTTSPQNAARPVAATAKAVLKQFPRRRHARWVHLWLCVVIVMTSLSVGPKTNAQSTTGGFVQDWFAQPTMLGDWGGLRSDLLHLGITPYLVYIGEAARNTNGLDGVATDYTQNFTVGADADLGYFGIDPGGTFHLGFSERAGRDLGPEKLGSLFQTFDVYGGGRDARLNEISLEQVFADEHLNIKIGFFPTAGLDPREFDWVPAFIDFITNAHHPVAMGYGAGWTYYPTGKWSGRVRFSPSDSLSIQFEVAQVNPSYGLSQNGFKVGFDGDTGIIVPLEITYQPQYDKNYPGMYKLGAYYDSSSAPDQLTPMKFDKGRKGFYFEGQQKIYSEASDPDLGLTVVGYYAAADGHTSQVTQNYHFGLSYQGAIPGRDLDKVNIGWFAVDLNPRIVAREEVTGAQVQSATEHLLEINYGAALAPWLEVKPGVQYSINPGSIESRPNAWVFLVRTQANF
jgi:porin